MRGPVRPFEKIEKQIQLSDNWPPIKDSKRFHNNSGKRVTEKMPEKNQLKETKADNIWIMRSVSTEGEMDPYLPSIINQSSLDSPIEQNANPMVSFSTFSGRGQTFNSFAKTVDEFDSGL